MSLKQTQERAIRNHVNLPNEIKALIHAASADLYGGPDAADVENYPGFETACREIRDALPRGDLWITVDGDVSDLEPEWFDADGEPQECSDEWTLLDFRTVKRILVGSALAEYV